MNSAIIQQRTLDDLFEYRKLVSQLSSSEVALFAARAVADFFEYHSLTSIPLRAAVELLCEINSHPDPDFSQLGLDALFPNLIEKLNDSFDPNLCEIYDRVFAQVISFCRLLPDMSDFDKALSDFNLPDEDSLFHRKRNLISNPHLLSNALPLKKILFLSRVTIGADVAITSALMAHLKKVFPRAELVLLGSNKLRELYGGEQSIRIHEISYGRGATLNSRLLSWLSILDSVREEIAGLSENEFCIIDPDSRLTQLGLLPICLDERNYFFFESRGFQRDGYDSLGQLSSVWINEICEAPPLDFPFLALSKVQNSFEKWLVSQLNRPVICLSFGVGGNDSKRLGFDFEVGLVRRLVKSYTIILDSGFSSSELAHSHQLESAFHSNEIPCLRLSEDFYHQVSDINLLPQRIIFWEGGIGSFASLISFSDQYIGYDSSGQHLAAALGIPVLTIFSNSPSVLFVQRWQPFGKSKTASVEFSINQLSGKNIFNLIDSTLCHLLL